jgi:hypothetical protein
VPLTVEVMSSREYDAGKKQSEEICNPPALRQHARDREAELRERFETIRAETQKQGGFFSRS